MDLLKSQTSIEDVYKKIKIVKGDQFVTIEDTKNLTNQEMLCLVADLVNKPYIQHAKNVTILVDSKFNEKVESLLLENGFTFHDENITVHKILNESCEEEFDYTFKTLHELSTNEFKSIWIEAMEGSLNPPSSLNIDELMRSVELELGPNYEDSCLVAFEKENPIGVVIPHIEPGTLDEGRLYYFGLVPNERGKGKSKRLHQQALKILESSYKATYYIGRTSHRNLPMLNTFAKNGCTVIEQNKVFKKPIHPLK